MGEHPPMPVKRSSELRPLSSEHHQALLVAFQLKQGLAGHGDSAGAPKDLPGLVALARRYEEALLRTHTRAEEELLGRHLDEQSLRRLKFEHAELIRLMELARNGQPAEARAGLQAFADLLERHIRWEERELFPRLEHLVPPDDLVHVGAELEKRLVLNKADPKANRRA
jgi:hemerythrin HHE cation binding domain-containing protein